MAYGTQTYRNSEAGVLAPREVEAAAFLFVNRALEGADSVHSKCDALCKNQKLWSLLLRDLACSANALPEILRADLVRLGTFSVAYSIRAMPGSLALQPLIDINRDMAEALRGAARTTPAPAAPASMAPPSLMAAV